ncbi:MAG: lamin tail domain-containing protein, partial [Planctomycetota bacterium]
MRVDRRILFAVLWASFPAGADETVYVLRGSPWRYRLGTEEASQPDPAAWRLPGFADAAWPEGPAPIGFGEPAIATTLPRPNPPAQPNYTCVFLRKEFSVSRPASVSAFAFRVLYDDGFVLWLNGIEVLRANFSGVPSLGAVADAAVPEPRPYEEFEFPQPAALLREGSNALAVQLFNNSVSSSDLLFDFELVDPFGPDLTPPAVSSVVPTPSATVRELRRIEVAFTEVVTGVDAADLLLDGLPATAVSGSGRGPYAFAFSPAPAGTVWAEWAPDPGIRDLADPPNAFAPPPRWSYRVDPSLPAADVVVSEILAANATGLADEDGETSDWIEIWNRGPAAADLSGWSLTDERDDPGKWVFPSVSLGAGRYLVVFASGKDRTPARGGSLHANFRLSSDGEYLGLFTPDSPRIAVSEFSPAYPEGRADISWGLAPDGSYRYLDPPTPGASNATAAALASFVAEPRISPPRGFYDAPISIEISTPTPGAAIAYTLDGREPGPGRGLAYAGPFELAGSARKAVHVVRAVAYRAGCLPSRVVTCTYIYLEHVPAQPPDPAGFPRTWGSAPAVDYEMDPEITGEPAARARIVEGLSALPSLSIAMDVADVFGPSGIYSNPTGEGVLYERPCSAEFLEPRAGGGWQVDCGIRIQGGASRLPEKSPKHSFRLLFKGDYGPTRLRERFFPDSDVASFDTITLRANFNNSWIHWDGAQRRRGCLIRDQWARDVQLAMGRVSSHGRYVHLYVDGLYWGVYNAVERPNASFAASYFGGEKEDYDALNAGEVVDGDATAWNALLSLANRDLSGLPAYEAVADYLDLPAFADYLVLHFYGGNEDWPHHNWYAVRRRRPRERFHFVSWDSERILEGVAADRTGVSDAGSPGALWARLRGNAEFRLLFADAVERHFFSGGALTPEGAAARWEARARELETAVACESARWGDYRRDVHPYANGPYELYTEEGHWTPERARLLSSYFPQRTAAVLDRFRALGFYPSVGAPVFSRGGGKISPGFSLSLSLPAGTSGTIYFTTDGSDPRAYGSGAVAPSALAYAAPIVLYDTTVVRARTWSGGAWSALAEATFSAVGPAEAVRLSEIHYHPPGAGGEEFVEVYNASEYAVDVSELAFTNGIRYVFPRGSLMAPGEHAVLAADLPAFGAVYPGIAVRGVFSGRLDNAGERLTLALPDGTAVESLAYNDGGFWPISPDGFGRSLVRAAFDGDPADPRSWRASAEPGGSPGRADPLPRHGWVFVNEVLPGGLPSVEAAIELANLSDRTIDLGGWFLSDSRADEASLRKHRIPPGSRIPPGGFFVVFERDFNSEPGTWPSFGLPSTGGAVYLASADAAGNLTGHIAGRTYDPVEEGVSLGRYETGSSVEFPPLSATTLGAPNASPRVGPVVVNEIHYHPGAGGDEFVELYNLSGEAVAIGGWRLDGVRDAEGAGDYEFPA